MKLKDLHVNSTRVPFVFEQNSALPIVSLKLIFTACGKIEDGKKAGLSRMSAKVLEEGTKKLGSNEFAKRMENRAIEFNVASGVETLSLSINSLSESFEYALNMLIKLLKDPNVTEDTIQKIKEITIGNILRKKSDFDYEANLNLQKLLYPNSPLENPSLGTQSSIKDISLKDVKEFLKTHLNIENAMVVIGGDLDESKAKEVAKKLLKVLPNGKKRETLHVKTSDKQKQEVLKRQSEQAYIYFGSPFYVSIADKDAYKAQVMAFILGSSGFGSRLMEEIRVKRGLAYSAYGRVGLERSSNAFLGYLQTKNENKDEAIKIVKEVVSEFVKNGVSKDELEQAKRFLLGSEPLRNETLSQRLSRDFLDIYSGHGVGYSKKKLELISKLTLEELNAFISSHKEIELLSFSIVTNEDV